MRHRNKTEYSPIQQHIKTLKKIMVVITYIDNSDDNSLEKKIVLSNHKND